MHQHKHKILFVLKYRKLYQDVLFNECEKKAPYSYFSSGLLNSATQVHEMLQSHDVHSKLVQVIDNNGIDKEVSSYKPTDVIIEALWVVPEKFEVLQKLHPKVRWIIRLHSETPFMANEGIAMDWVMKYVTYKNVYVAVNSERMLGDLKAILSEKQQRKLMYLPNYYDLEKNRERNIPTALKDKSNILDIACFGAIRPLKNQLIQAMAAIQYAKEVGKKLRFHINGSRIENNGNNVYKNIVALFDNLDHSRFVLVEHPWLEPKDFRKLCSLMDMGMQVSFSETHNIVSCDFVAQNVPIVVSKEIDWAACPSQVEDPTDIREIVETMHIVKALSKIGLTYLNKWSLGRYNKATVREWLNTFKH